MISEERILEIYAKNPITATPWKENRDWSATRFARAVEAEVTAPLESKIKQLEQENAERQRDEYKADAADEISRLKAAYDQAGRTIQEQGRAIDRLITERDKPCQIFKATIEEQDKRIKELEGAATSWFEKYEMKAQQVIEIGNQLHLVNGKQHRKGEAK